MIWATFEEPQAVRRDSVIHRLKALTLLLPRGTVWPHAVRGPAELYACHSRHLTGRAPWFRAIVRSISDSLNAYYLLLGTSATHRAPSGTAFTLLDAASART